MSELAWVKRPINPIALRMTKTLLTFFAILSAIGLTLGHMEMGPRFKVASERLEKWEIDLATPGLVAQYVIHGTTLQPQ